MWRGEHKLREFIDKTSEQSGTPINRDYLMAIQGFDAVDTVFGENTITETNSRGETLTTTFNSDGSITERFVGVKTITKITQFDANGNTREVIS